MRVNKLKTNKIMKKEKKEKQKKVDVGVAELSEQVSQMMAGINAIAGAVGKLVELQTAPKEVPSSTVTATAEKPQTQFNPKMEDETYPNKYIPPKYRQIVTEILSEEFGLDITDFDDRTDFQVHIIVPEKYSSVIPEDRKKGVQDIRSRMVPRSLGENGVREWCTLIRQNLNKYYTREGKASPFIN